MNKKIILNFLEQTVKKHDSYWSDRIFIDVNEKEIKSTSRDFYNGVRDELATIKFEEAQVSSFEELSDELTDIIQSSSYMEYSKNSAAYTGYFNILLRYHVRGEIEDHNLVTVDDGTVSIDYYRYKVSSLSDLKGCIFSIGDKFYPVYKHHYHHLQIDDDYLITSCLIAATHKSKEDICSHYGIDPYLLENEELGYYPINKEIILIDRNYHKSKPLLFSGQFQNAVKIINTLNSVNARMEVEINGKVDIVK